MSDASEHNDKVLADIKAKAASDKAKDRCSVILASLGVDAAVARIASESTTLAAALDWSTASPEEAKTIIAEQYAALLPTTAAAKTDEPVVDAALLASAASGNQTARARLARSLGDGKNADAAKADELIAATQAKQTEAANTHKNNPFSKASWNVSAQGRLIRAIGLEAAAGIAASVNSKIGATRPSM